MTSRTYKEWRAEGFQVKRGERATGRNASGEATFTDEQVKDLFDDGDYDFLSSEEMEFVDSEYFRDVGDR